METPRPPFMKSLIIYFPSIFLAKKIDDFEGCLKGVAMCLNADSTLLVNTALAQAQPPRNRLLQMFKPTHFVSKVLLSHLKRNTWPSSLTID